VTTTRQLIWSLVISAVVVVAASGLALWLIPQLSLEATMRGGTITLFAIVGVRLARWAALLRKQSR
jgi:hypothetical protein